MEQVSMVDKPILACRWRPYYSTNVLQEQISEVIQAVHADYQNCFMALPYTLLKQFDPSQMPPGTWLGIDHIMAIDAERLPVSSMSRMYAEAQAACVVIGDQSDRLIFDETDDKIRWQLEQALQAELNVILCVQQPSTQLECYLRDLSEEQLAKVLIALQGAWSSFYAGAGLLPELYSAVDEYKVHREHLPGTENVPLLLSLPSMVDDVQELTEAMALYCQGYYFGSASTHTPQVLELLRALVIHAQTVAVNKALEQPVMTPIEETAVPQEPEVVMSLPSYKDDPSVFDGSVGAGQEELAAAPFELVEEEELEDQVTQADQVTDVEIAEAFGESLPPPPSEEERQDQHDDR